ncbi:helix-turn-helix domain-containing protein [Pseudoclavibacter sp. JSM 162008]|uniref:helix-turn-helix domain-containing protein n=1 Tax=Pseudoclavibacter sp. JSM 162008 TaxID=3229855 RepID=UPI0035244018
MIAPRRGVNLTDLLASQSGDELTPHHLPAHPQAVREVIIITNVDDVLGVGPDSIVLLGEELALGGWVVSVALRYAWERHAVAVIVSEQVFSDSIIELARRFGVALLTTSSTIDRAAVSLARELGALEAGVLSRLDALQSRVARSTSPQRALEALALEFGGAGVHLVVGGIELFGAGQPPADAIEVRRVLNPRAYDCELRALVARGQQEFADQALARAAATIHSLLMAQELADIDAAAPLLSFAELAGTPAAPSLDREATVRSPRDDARARHGAPLTVVVLRVEHDDDLAAARLAPVVSQRWRTAFPKLPLARASGGWFAFVPQERAESELRRSLEGLLSGLGGEARRLELAVGLASGSAGEESALLRRAHLASRLARRSEIVDVENIGVPLLRRLLPREDALALAEVSYPDLLADPQADEVMRAVLAYLDAAGSGTAAAMRLGVHRNTLQGRLRRAAELGISPDRPELILPVHLLLTALVADSPQQLLPLTDRTNHESESHE